MCKNSKVLGELFEEKTEHLKKKMIVKDLRGRGLFRSFEFNDGVTGRDFAMKAFEKHKMLVRYHGQCLRLLPPLNIKSAQLEHIIGICEDVIDELS
eukprot:NODE_9625_length_362_cov_37.680511_g8719_i0.p1 GENE.NODE_9625_length_362_cov_37.680511_g8719_i0~~NODE_9625_length_362_cov_37.680511_g8719_i0.p1  ORF type:complete len:96 (-),score=5.05 NODE_9625_length_362_cov_37.680511_g8719_i0:33-320(-)